MEGVLNPVPILVAVLERPWAAPCGSNAINSISNSLSAGRPKDAFIVHADVLNDPNILRFSQEITANNTDRLPAFHTFNVRIDSRRQIGRIAFVSFLDIVNVYNHLNINEARFLELNGQEDRRGFEILPTLGVKIEY